MVRSPDCPIILVIDVRLCELRVGQQTESRSAPKGRQQMWESAKVSHKRVFALLTPEIRGWKTAQMLQKPVFALPGCQRTSVNTLLCDTLGLAENGRNRFLQQSAVFCGFLRTSAVSCGFLRKSATPKSLDLQSEPENQRKSAKMCVPGPISPFCCLPFGAPRERWGVEKPLTST